MNEIALDKKKISNKKSIIILSLILVLVIGAIGGFIAYKNSFTTIDMKDFAKISFRETDDGVMVDIEVDEFDFAMAVFEAFDIKMPFTQSEEDFNDHLEDAEIEKADFLEKYADAPTIRKVSVVAQSAEQYAYYLNGQMEDSQFVKAGDTFKVRFETNNEYETEKENEEWFKECKELCKEYKIKFKNQIIEQKVTEQDIKNSSSTIKK